MNPNRKNPFLLTELAVVLAVGLHFGVEVTGGSSALISLGGGRGGGGGGGSGVLGFVHGDCLTDVGDLDLLASGGAWGWDFASEEVFWVFTVDIAAAGFGAAVIVTGLATVAVADFGTLTIGAFVIVTLWVGIEAIALVSHTEAARDLIVEVFEGLVAKKLKWKSFRLNSESLNIYFHFTLCDAYDHPWLFFSNDIIH